MLQLALAWYLTLRVAAKCQSFQQVGLSLYAAVRGYTQLRSKRHSSPNVLWGPSCCVGHRASVPRDALRMAGMVEHKPTVDVCDAAMWRLRRLALELATSREPPLGTLNSTHFLRPTLAISRTPPVCRGFGAGLLMCFGKLSTASSNMTPCPPTTLSLHAGCDCNSQR